MEEVDQQIETGEEDYEVVENNDDEYEYYSEDEYQCHLDKRIWEEAKLQGQMDPSCPPYYDRHALLISDKTDYVLPLLLSKKIFISYCDDSRWNNEPITVGSHAGLQSLRERLLPSLVSAT